MTTNQTENQVETKVITKPKISTKTLIAIGLFLIGGILAYAAVGTTMFGTKHKITLLSPNGGERLVIGQTYPIKWQSSDSLKNKEFSIMLYDRSHFVKMLQGPTKFKWDAEGTMTYSWFVSDVPVGENIFEIWVSTQLSKNSTLRDQSDNKFSIVAATAPFIEATSDDPASAMLSHSGLSVFNAVKVVDNNIGPHAWKTDNSAPGAWLKINLGPGNEKNYVKARIYANTAGYTGNYNVQYSDDDSTWTDAATGFIPSIAGWNEKTWDYVGKHSYWRFLLANAPGGEGSGLNELEMYKIVIPASIPTSITVLSPNGGETWEIGKIYDIIWKSGSAGSVYISWHGFDSSGKETGAYVIANAIPVNSGRFSWTIPQNVIFSNKERSKILVSLSPTATISSSADQDISDAPFSISSLIASSLTARPTNVNATLIKNYSDTSSLTFADGFSITNAGNLVTSWQLYNNQDGTFTPPKEQTPRPVTVQGFGFYEASGGIGANQSTNIRVYVNNKMVPGTYRGSYKLQELKSGGATIDVATITYNLSVVEPASPPTSPSILP